MNLKINLQNKNNALFVIEWLNEQGIPQVIELEARIVVRGSGHLLEVVYHPRNLETIFPEITVLSVAKDRYQY